MRFTKKMATDFENDVVKRLNKKNVNGTTYRVCEEEFSCYDIIGIKDLHTLSLVEVKQRDDKFDHPRFDTWFIEKQKVDAMLKIQEEYHDKGIHVILGLAVGCNGTTRLYNVDTIRNHPIKQIPMNKTTAEGFNRQGEKVLKDVYIFPKDITNTIL